MPQSGWIEVICGSMFSGKTEELIRRVKRATIAKQKVILFKPQLDQRYDGKKIVSHDDNRLEAVSVAEPKDMISLSEGFDVIGIDEAQFFPPSIVSVCETLASQGKRVVVSGLDQDYLGKPFGSMPELLAIAEYITKNLAICMACGSPANKSQRLSATQEQVLLGGHDRYEARCRNCFRTQAQQRSPREEYTGLQHTNSVAIKTSTPRG
ncbi:MAG: thymidine kinase [Bdellovibrionales bacterium]|nr:thymidine kinase [Bdellovibrionales bacterium]